MLDSNIFYKMKLNELYIVFSQIHICYSKLLLISFDERMTVYDEYMKTNVLVKFLCSAKDSYKL